MVLLHLQANLYVIPETPRASIELEGRVIGILWTGRVTDQMRSGGFVAKLAMEEAT